MFPFGTSKHTITTNFCHIFCQFIKVWRQFRRILFDFIDVCPFTWNTIDQTLINRFITYLERDCDYLKKTRNKYLGLFRHIKSDSEKQGYHNNSIAKHLVKKLNVRDNDKTKSIYLTKEELDGLYGMRLEGTEEIVRDLFLIGVYTCQRFRDYSTLNESCFGTTQNGTPVISKDTHNLGGTNNVNCKIERQCLVLVAESGAPADL